MLKRKDIVKNLFFVALVASMIFIIQSIMTGAPFVGYGDYYDQQIAFYQHGHEFIKSGNWLWDWNSELGSEFIPAFAFYFVFSPFFWLTIPFPNEWMIYMMPVLLVIKLVTMNATSILFFKDKFKNKSLVFLAAFLYTFCGFTFDSLFFNHFIDVMAIFPLYLWSFDNVVMGKKRGLFAILTTISLLNNYYFWFGQVIFIALYFVTRVIFDKGYVVTLKNFINFVIEGLIGLGISCVFLFPIINTVFSNPRANAKISENILTYENLQYYFSIIKSSLTFPNPTIWQGDLFKYLRYGCPSQVLYVTGIGMFLIPGFFIKKNDKWMKIFLIILTIFAMVPVLNASFSLFSDTYYARWYYMFTFFIIWASLIFVDNYEFSDIQKMSKIGGLIVSLIFIICVIAGWILHISVSSDISWSNVYFAIGSFLLTEILFFINIHVKNQREFVQRTIVLSSIFLLIIYSGITFEKKVIEPKSDLSAYYKYDQLQNVESKTIPKNDEFFRILNDNYVNTGLLYNISSVLGYNSITTSSIYDFYNLLGFDREVKSDFINKDSDLIKLFSTKYVWIDNDEGYWKQVDDYLPLGVVFENLEPVENWDKFITTEKKLANTLYLDYDIYNKFQQFDKAKDTSTKNLKIEDVNILLEYEKEYTKYTYSSNHPITIPNLCKTNEIKDIRINEANAQLAGTAYCDGENLRVDKTGDITILALSNSIFDVYSAGVEDIKTSQYGLSANIEAKNDQLVFFTIPYTDLWTAYIDNEEVPIYKGDNAFITLFIPSGEHTIDIVYSTKYYKIGLIVTSISLLCLACFCAVKKKKA